MKFPVVILALTFVFQSCISTSNLVEAESLGKMNQSVLFSGELIVIPDDGDIGLWPYGIVQYGIGVSDRFDIRATASTNSYLDVQGKYQFYKSDTWNLAAGASADFWLRLPHPKLHLYSQYKFDNMSILINPSVEFNSSTLAAQPDISYGPIYSLSTGIMRGEKNRWKFSLNGGYIPNSDFKWTVGLGAAYDLRINKK